MKQKEIIEKMKKQISSFAYKARIFEEIKGLNFDVGMMEYYQHSNSGSAFGIMEILNFATKDYESTDNLYTKAVDEATEDVIKANYNIVKLLDLVGFNGELYYESYNKNHAE